MINGHKVGCGIITFNRPTLLAKLYTSLPSQVLDSVIIINDGAWYDDFKNYPPEIFKHNKSNLGVAKSKNKALEHLLEKKCEHLFLIEDDIFIKDHTVFEQYILTSLITGIQHLNFSQHGLLNKKPDHSPNPVNIIDYGNGISLPLYRHCVGAFSYYSRLSLETCGLMDENFYNAFEHVEHTLRIGNDLMHPPFWFFPDIPDSHLLLGDEPWSIAQSTISSDPQQPGRTAEALKYFELKHGHPPAKVPLATSEELINCLNAIKSNYGINH